MKFKVNCIPVISILFRTQQDVSFEEMRQIVRLNMSHASPNSHLCFWVLPVNWISSFPNPVFLISLSSMHLSRSISYILSSKILLSPSIPGTVSRYERARWVRQGSFQGKPMVWWRRLTQRWFQHKRMNPVVEVCRYVIHYLKSQRGCQCTS